VAAVPSGLRAAGVSALDWRAYEEVNAKFADVVAAEANTDSPVVMIQDFHFALLPKLIRAKIPKATIALFWHIPWPNAETFGVCPWKREILLHMLSADILGFPHALSLPELSRDGGSLRRMPDRSRAHDGDLAGPGVPGRALSHIHRMAAALAQELPDVASCRAAVRERTTSAPTWSSGSAWSAGTSPRASSSAFMRWRRCSTRIRGTADASACCRSRRRRAARCRRTSAAGANLQRGRAHQRQVRRGLWRPIVLIDQHQEPARCSNCIAPRISAWSTACTTA
jgi:hypothetical protein